MNLDFEDSLIDIHWRFPGYLETNKIKTGIPKTSQPELGVPVESGAMVSSPLFFHDELHDLFRVTLLL